MTAVEFKKKMVRINKHFDKIEDIINTLPNGIQDEINEYHTDYGLILCTRWGLQASEELRDDTKRFIRKATNNGSN